MSDSFGGGEAVKGGRSPIEGRLTRIEERKAAAEAKRRESEEGDAARGRKVGYIHEKIKSLTERARTELAEQNNAESRGEELKTIVLDALLLDDTAIGNARKSYEVMSEDDQPTDEAVVQGAYDRYTTLKDKARQTLPAFGKMRGGSKIRDEIRQARQIVSDFEEKTGQVYTDSTRVFAAGATLALEKMANESGYRMETYNEGPFVKIKLVPMTEVQLKAYAWSTVVHESGVKVAEAEKTFTPDEVEAAKKAAVDAALDEERKRVKDEKDHQDKLDAIAAQQAKLDQDRAIFEAEKRAYASGLADGRRTKARAGDSPETFAERPN